MEHIVWETPPEEGRKGRYVWFFDALRDRPGEWAVAPFSKSSANSVAKRQMRGTETGEWEVVTRRVRLPDKGGKYEERVYVRYIGESKQDAEAPKRQGQDKAA